MRTNDGISASFDNYQVNPVPQPVSLALLGLGTLALLLWWRA